MLDYSASQLRDERITWQPDDAQALPFPDASFDVVCCQFGAMFFPKRDAAYSEARRVLKPPGHFILSAWDRIEDNVFADEVTTALAELFPDDPRRSRSGRRSVTVRAPVPRRAVLNLANFCKEFDQAMVLARLELPAGHDATAGGAIELPG